MVIRILHHPDGDLMRVAQAQRPQPRPPRLLHRRHQQRRQDRDDRDDNEKLDEGEPSAAHIGLSFHSPNILSPKPLLQAKRVVPVLENSGV